MKRILSVLVLLVASCPAFAMPVKVSGKHGAGSGTVVESRNGTSLVLTCNHIFATQPRPGAPFDRAKIGQRVTVTAGKTAYEATLVEADIATDSAWLVVGKEFIPTPLAPADAAVGDPVWLKVAGKISTRGTVLAQRGEKTSRAARFVASPTAESGDSGGAVLNQKGEVVALVCGRDGTARGLPLRGTPVSELNPAQWFAGTVAQIEFSPGWAMLYVAFEEDIDGDRAWIAPDYPRSDVRWNGRRVSAKQLLALLLTADGPVTFTGANAPDSYGVVTQGDFRTSTQRTDK